MVKVFIDGSAGTTGLRIHDRLSKREDIELLTLSEEQRKDITARKKMLNCCDLAFLCLPDEASREALTLIDNPEVIIIDTSTAHRTNEGWAYGFSELSSEFNAKIKNSKRIAVPGCHASGFIALVYPLIKEGIIDKSVLLTCTSLTGYSGGGKKLIAEYQSEDREDYLNSPRQYGIGQTHKHLKEMVSICGLQNPPIFLPIVGDFYSGMEVTVPLFSQQLKAGKRVEDVKTVYKKYYHDSVVSYFESIDENGFIASNAKSGKDGMQITVTGNEDRMLLVARYDNLGKGASGAAIECMNIALNKEKSLGLDL